MMVHQSLPIVQKTINMPGTMKETTKSPNQTINPVTEPEEKQEGYQNGDNNEEEQEQNNDVEIRPVITKEQIEAELNSVAVEWKPLRNCYECACGSPLEGTVNKKTHCRKCGNVFCKRCVRTKLELPGHFSKKLVPVCNACHKQLVADQRSSQTTMGQAEAAL